MSPLPSFSIWLRSPRSCQQRPTLGFLPSLRCTSPHLLTPASPASCRCGPWHSCRRPYLRGLSIAAGNSAAALPPPRPLTLVGASLHPAASECSVVLITQYSVPCQVYVRVWTFTRRWPLAYINANVCRDVPSVVCAPQTCFNPCAHCCVPYH